MYQIIIFACSSVVYSLEEQGVLLNEVLVNHLLLGNDKKAFA